MLQAFDRCKKSLPIKFNQTAAVNHGKWPLRIQFQHFGANFADRWPRWTGARLIEVLLHSKSFGGALKWPLKGGSRLIQVTATAGLTVVMIDDAGRNQSSDSGVSGMAPSQVQQIQLASEKFQGVHS